MTEQEKRVCKCGHERASHYSTPIRPDLVEGCLAAWCECKRYERDEDAS